MKALFGAFLMIVGVVLGIYVGLWVMFAGGIKSIVAGSVLWGLIKMLLLPWISGFVIALIGCKLGVSFVVSDKTTLGLEVAQRVKNFVESVDKFSKKHQKK